MKHVTNISIQIQRAIIHMLAAMRMCFAAGELLGGNLRGMSRE